MRRGWLFVSVLAMVPAVASGAAPSWPDIHLAACPPITPQQSARAKVWKHGRAEKDAFLSALAQLGAKNYSQAAKQLSGFVKKYPDSDYLTAALFGEMAALDEQKDIASQVKVAEQLVELPSAPAVVRTAAFVSLDSLLSPYAPAGDPAESRKLADLEKWTECGKVALAGESRPSGAASGGIDKTIRTGESVFDRTGGYVALVRKHYESARSQLLTANKLNPADPLTNLWLFEAYALSPKPNYNAGVFFLARVSHLAPQVPQLDALLRRVYVMLHGSENGLIDLRAEALSSSVPPQGLNILPTPKRHHHYGATLAAAAIIGALAYGMVKYPWVAEGVSNSVSGEAASPSKLMIFGGPNHKTYLGCLSCSPAASDSVFNRAGPYGSRVAGDSIWNPVGDFGSPVSEYSACNPTAGEPPVIVDERGKAYGRLTLNHSDPNIGAGRQLYGWLSATVCSAGRYLP